MPSANTQFKKGQAKPKNAYVFPTGDSNPAKNETVRRKLRRDKLGSKNPMYGKKASKETKAKMRASAQWGAKNVNWKGGVTSINEQLRKSPEYKLWRESVFTRDNYTCIWCGKKFAKGKTGRVTLHADHIKPFSLFPELRFAIDNGRTLCVDCHKKTPTYMNGHLKIEEYL